jgi:hypothetical protein
MPGIRLARRVCVRSCATTVVVALGRRSVVGVSGDKLVDDTGATFQDLRARPTVAAAQLNWVQLHRFCPRLLCVCWIRRAPIDAANCAAQRGADCSPARAVGAGVERPLVLPADHEVSAGTGSARFVDTTGTLATAESQARFSAVGGRARLRQEGQARLR